MESKEKLLYIRAVTQGHDVKLVMNLKSSRKAIAFLTVIPNGIVAMSADIEGLVETSLNVGILKSGEKEIVTSSAIRSSIESAKHKVFLQVDTLCGIFGGYTESHGDYPGWQFNPDSQLRADMIEIYKKMFGKDVKVEALHAGLECGIMMAKIPGLDCVSFGPDISDIHTTEEKLSISSTERMWNYLIEILKH
jgi:dipeptidase D